MKGWFPRILEHADLRRRGPELFDDARRVLDRIVAEKLLHARGVYGFWPANTDGDDLVALRRRDAARRCARFSMLRQQEVIGQGPRAAFPGRLRCAPESACHRLSRRVRGHGGLGVENCASSYERDHDDYNAIMVKALADRLAEAFAEYLHERVRASGVTDGTSG